MESLKDTQRFIRFSPESLILVEIDFLNHRGETDQALELIKELEKK